MSIAPGATISSSRTATVSSELLQLRGVVKNESLLISFSIFSFFFFFLLFLVFGFWLLQANPPVQRAGLIHNVQRSRWLLPRHVGHRGIATDVHGRRGQSLSLSLSLSSVVVFVVVATMSNSVSFQLFGFTR